LNNQISRIDEKQNLGFDVVFMNDLLSQRMKTTEKERRSQ
jgi:hypothetical protein